MSNNFPSDPSSDADNNPVRDDQLEAVLSDHSGFIASRLQNFVGRQSELAEIRQLIAELLPSGGYLTITGSPGQGKSTLIAYLVNHQSGNSQVAHHFIPLNPGPDHQFQLLRDLMARLSLKYKLPVLYLAGSTRATLQELFPKVLEEVVAKGGQEVIFIDGLDQLQAENEGERDLTFLPTNPPPGIVFVLGTRPNDTLKPLQLLKPQQHYHLPQLSRPDFDLLLAHYQLQLNLNLADELYRAMEGNPLYLDLLAKELALTPQPTSLMEIIQAVSSNPDQIFSIALQRLQHDQLQWSQLIRPILGILLASQQPLSRDSLGQILGTGVALNSLTEALDRLGGLLAQDGQGRYYLFHLKLSDYLRAQEGQLAEFSFTSEEEASWHSRLADWAEQTDPAQLWQEAATPAEQTRREYARHHYITHLFRAGNWQKLFEVLDQGEYGRAKVKFDPSQRLYVQDLKLGRTAAAREEWDFETALRLLPRLWRYSLLSASMVRQADNYPPEAFEAMLLLGQTTQVLGLAELLTLPSRRADTLARVAAYLRRQPGKEAEARALLIRAYQTARQQRGGTGGGRVGGQVDWHEESLEVLAHLLEDSQASDSAIVEQALELAHSLSYSLEVRALVMIANWLGEAGEENQARILLDEALQLTRVPWNPMVNDKAVALGAVALGFRLLGDIQQSDQLFNEPVETTPQMPMGKEVAQVKVPSLLVEYLISARQWNRAEEVARSIPLMLASTSFDESGKPTQNFSSYNRSRSLVRLVDGLLQDGQSEKALEVAHSIEHKPFKAGALGEVALQLIAAGQTEQAKLLLNEALSVLDTPETRYPVQPFLAVFKGLVMTEQEQQALELLNSLRDPYSKALVLTTIIARLQAEPSRALAFIEEATGLARSSREQQDLEQKRYPSRSIYSQQLGSRSRALSLIALELVRLGEKELAYQRLQEINRSSTTSLSPREHKMQLKLWLKLAEQLAKSGEKSQALELYEQVAPQLLASSQDVSYRSGEIKQLELAEQLVKGLKMLGEEEKAYHWFEQITTRFSTQTHYMMDVSERMAVVRSWQALGKPEQALTVLNGIAEYSRTIQNWPRPGKEQAVKALVLGGYWLKQFGQVEAGEALLSEAREKIEVFEDPYSRIIALSDLVEKLAWLGRTAEAAEVLTEVSVLAQSLENESYQPGTPQESQRIEAVKARITGVLALEGWDEALKLASLFNQDSLNWSRAVVEIIRAMTKAKEHKRAIELISSLNWRPAKVEGLTIIARGLIEVGSVAQAGQLLGNSLSLEELLSCYKYFGLLEPGEEIALLVETGETGSHPNKELALATIQRAWLQAGTSQEMLQVLNGANAFISLVPELGSAFVAGFEWVNDFVKS